MPCHLDVTGEPHLSGCDANKQKSGQAFLTPGAQLLSLVYH